MRTFERISFLRMFGMTIVTLGIYPWIWIIETKRRLNKIGGNVPNGFFMIVPIVSVWFYYCYAESYTKVIKKKHDIVSIMLYFMLIGFDTISTLGGIFAFGKTDIGIYLSFKVSKFWWSLISDHGLPSFYEQALLLLLCFISYSVLRVFFLYVLQRGYNEYEG